MTDTPHKPQPPRPELARLRRHAGHTQETLAEQLGVERTTVARWERGACEPYPHVRPQLAAALGISLETMAELLADDSCARPAWAVRLRAEREARGWNKHEMARRLYSAVGITNGVVVSLTRQILDWEAGKHFPRDWRIAYAIAFGVDETELFGEGCHRPGGRPAIADPPPEEDVERRELLQLLAALGITVSPAVLALDAIQRSVGRSFESGELHQVSHWEETAAEYGYSYLATPPQRLVQDLATDLVSFRLVTRDVDRDSAVYREWCRIGSALSGLMAMTLGNLGHTRESRHWWQTAQIAADGSGDLDARLRVRGERLVRGLYERRPLHLVLRQANDAFELAQEHPCAGSATISAARAQALVLVGQDGAAERELARVEDIFTRLPAQVAGDSDSVNGWGEDRLRYTETWVYAHSGHVAKADTAALRAMPCYPSSDQRTPTQIKLLQAYARTRAGDITEGVRHAHATYEVLAPEHRTAMVTDLARRVLDTIPPDRQAQPPVTAYRELLAVSTPSPGKAIES